MNYAGRSHITDSHKSTVRQVAERQRVLSISDFVLVFGGTTSEIIIYELLVSTFRLKQHFFLVKNRITYCGLFLYKKLAGTALRLRSILSLSKYWYLLNRSSYTGVFWSAITQKLLSGLCSKNVKCRYAHYLRTIFAHNIVKLIPITLVYASTCVYFLSRLSIMVWFWKFLQ
jgi:hypothetical protein